MKIGTAVKTVLIIAFCLCLTSCNALDIFSVDSLIRPPKITGQYSQLQSAFEDIAGPDAKTVSPVSGEYRSAYSLVDLDTDNTEEAIVFFKRPNEDSVSLVLLKYVSDNWIALDRTGGNASGVHEVFFCDLDSDGCSEIAVIWSSNDSGITDKTMTVYSVSSGEGTISEFNALASISVDSYKIHTFCLGGENDVFYICHGAGPEGTKLYAQLLSFGSGGKVPSPVSKIGLDSATESVENIIFEDNASGTRVFLDCKSSDGTYFTEIVDFNKTNSAFSIPDGTENIYSSGITSRKNAVYCTDIDEDGNIEIPADIPFLNGKTPDGENAGVSMVEWLEFSDGEFTSDEKSFVNIADGYSLCMDSLYGMSYISYDSSSRTARWYKTEGYPGEGINSGKILFSVIFTGISSEETEKSDYLVVVTEIGESAGIKKSHISSLIEPLN